jgi:hypothetical protein
MPGTNVKPHSGAIMTSVSNAVANVNGDGYGARLEVVISHP